jgi:uncharacterized protein (TIGR01777 family)
MEKLATLKVPPAIFISGSAIGYYGPQGDEAVSESSPGRESFSHELCEAWERTALDAKDLGMRVCLLRTGIVLGEGGALKKMRLPFLMGLGGPISTGKQWMSWIHIADMIRVIHFCLEQPTLQGPVNATSPNPVTNNDFAHTLGKVLHRPTFLRMPGFVLRLIYGSAMAEELLLTGQRVLPTKLLQLGFNFVYTDLELALHAILHK